MSSIHDPTHFHQLKFWDRKDHLRQTAFEQLEYYQPRIRIVRALKTSRCGGKHTYPLFKATPQGEVTCLNATFELPMSEGSLYLVHCLDP